ncbi:MAG: ribbon-helix-helix protein, CopG family [Myxococcota bacterium]|nr:ribbon-helix-helix protein, CopG family [Myxococcota bacterium]
MPDKDTLSVRLDPAKRAQLDRLAASMDRPRSYLVGQAIDQFLDYHAWKLERIEEGRAAADRGDTVFHEDLFGELRQRYRAKPQ